MDNRLTYRNSAGVACLYDWEGKARMDECNAELLENAVERLCRFEDQGDTLRSDVERLRADNDGFRASIKTGRLVRFPVEPGQIVYARTGIFFNGYIGYALGEYVPCKVVTCKRTAKGMEFSIYPQTFTARQYHKRYHKWVSPGAIGVTVFLTEAAAKAIVGG